jgi:hypothetical protein
LLFRISSFEIRISGEVSGLGFAGLGVVLRGGNDPARLGRPGLSEIGAVRRMTGNGESGLFESCAHPAGEFLPLFSITPT